LIAGNMTIMNAASSDTGAIRTEVVQGELLIHGNRLRGNGGYALSMQEWGSPGCISVEGNYMDNTATASTNPTYNFIEVYCSSVLHFENNICTFVTGANYTFGRGAMIFGGDLIVNGNTIKMTKTQANGSYETIRIYCVGAHGIATSNLLTGGPTFPFNGTLIQANNSAV
jgi:hypothetical protein